VASGPVLYLFWQQVDPRGIRRAFGGEEAGRLEHEGGREAGGSTSQTSTTAPKCLAASAVPLPTGGHGVASACDGGVLINTSRMRGVHVDPEAQTARVEPGTLWRDAIPEALVFGLAGLLGSSSGVGVVSYTLGGGYGWLTRKYGFNADLVTADGE
jgi:hypothetical protein